MVALVQDPMPDYIVIIPLLYGAFFVLVLLAVAVARAGRPRPRNTGPGDRAGRPADGNSSEDDDIWLATYLSEVHREQYHDTR